MLGLALVYRTLPSTRNLSLVVAEGEECHLDTIRHQGLVVSHGNVLGKWLHVRLFVSEVALEFLVVSL